MSEINGTTEKVRIEDGIDDIQLSKFRFASRNLVISDCEGAERELFTARSLTNLLETDLLIEVHDPEKDEITQNLLLLFSPSHAITTIPCRSDEYRVENYCFHPVGKHSQRRIRQLAYSECRQGSIKWLWLKAQTAKNRRT
jgi:hypothetical protein